MFVPLAQWQSLHDLRPLDAGSSRVWMTDDDGMGCHEALLAAIAERRDRRAFAAVFGHFAPRLKTYFERSGLGSAAAEDLMQEAMLIVWHKASQFDSRAGTAAGWIFTIARNLRIDRARRDRRALPAADPSQEAPPMPWADELVAASRAAEAVRQAVEALPAEQMAILRLAFFEDRSHGDIERLLGVPLGTIKSRLRLAMAKLRSALAQNDD